MDKWKIFFLRTCKRTSSSRVQSPAVHLNCPSAWADLRPAERLSLSVFCGSLWVNILSKSSIPHLLSACSSALICQALITADWADLEGIRASDKVIVARRISETVHLRVNFVIGNRSKRDIYVDFISCWIQGFFLYFLSFCPHFTRSSLFWWLRVEALFHLTCCQVHDWIFAFVTFFLDITCNILWNHITLSRFVSQIY